jgi:Fur family transcriptional regulator, peroxide stress response regulator
MNTIGQNLKHFEDTCRKTGLKITHQRLEIYRELLAAKDHPTAETLHKRLLQRLPLISIDTVYRTLTTFALHRLANRVETAESLSRFEVAQDPHHHLICKYCNSIVDFFWPALAEIPLPVEVGRWGTVENKVMVTYGKCRSCRDMKE